MSDAPAAAMPAAILIAEDNENDVLQTREGLDVHIPPMDGREVRATLVADLGACHRPVGLPITPTDRREILQMYRLRCWSYIVNPIEFEGFPPVLRVISEY